VSDRTVSTTLRVNFLAGILACMRGTNFRLVYRQEVTVARRVQSPHSCYFNVFIHCQDNQSISQEIFKVVYPQREGQGMEAETDAVLGSLNCRNE